MKITKRQLRRIIREEFGREMELLTEGYMVPRFTNTASMEDWIEELEPDDAVNQDVVDPETGRLVIPAGESPGDQDWWTEVTTATATPEQDKDEFDWDAYEKRLDTEAEEQQRKDDRIQDTLASEATAGGGDWAADTYSDARNNPDMWKDYHGVETAEDYVMALGQDAAGDIADSLLKYSSEPEVAAWYRSLPDRDRPYNNRPTKSAMRDALADYFYDGVSKAIEKRKAA